MRGAENSQNRKDRLTVTAPSISPLWISSFLFTAHRKPARDAGTATAAPRMAARSKADWEANQPGNHWQMDSPNLAVSWMPLPQTRISLAS